MSDTDKFLSQLALDGKLSQNYFGIPIETEEDRIARIHRPNTEPPVKFSVVIKDPICQECQRGSCRDCPR